MINIFNARIKPWEFEILLNYPVGGDSERGEGSQLYLHIFKAKNHGYFKIQYREFNRQNRSLQKYQICRTSRQLTLNRITET